MTSDLKQLLHDSAAQAPDEPHSVTDIVRSARRHHRRRTAKLGAGALAAVVLVAGVGYAALRGTDSDDAQPVTNDRGDITLRLSDARSAVPGKDYEVVTTVDATAVSTFPWSPDGPVLIQPEADEFATITVDSLDPTPIETPPGALFPSYVGEGHVLWGVETSGGPEVRAQNLSSGAWSEIPMTVVGDTPERSFDGFTIDSGRVWATVRPRGSDGPKAPTRLVSAPLDGSAGFRIELGGERVGASAVGDGHLVWQSQAGGPLMARDLATGEQSEVAPAPSDGCLYGGILVAGDHVAAEESCLGSGVGRTTVWSLDGGGEVHIDQYLIEAGLGSGGALGEEGVLIQSIEDSRLQTFLYRFDTGELLDLGSVEVSYDAAETLWPVRTGGDVVIFPSPDKDGHLTLAELK